MTTTNDTCVANATALQAGPQCSSFAELYKPRLATGVHFFIVYAFLALFTILGNSFIVAAVTAGGGFPVGARRTFRFLTLLLSGYELLAGSVLLLMLFYLGVGYHNRTSGGDPVWPGWLSEDENPYLSRGYSLPKFLTSLRDVTIGLEVNAYCLLAFDRLLAVAAPLSRRWNLAAARGLACAVVAVAVLGEVSLQIWLMLGLMSHSGQTDTSTVCQFLAAHKSANSLVKAGLAVVNYVASLASYLGTGALLIGRWRQKRRRAAPAPGAIAAAAPNSDEKPEQPQPPPQQTGEPMLRPLMALIVGNLVQFFSLVPMVLDNMGLVHLEISCYYIFYVNSAAVPCITIVFNRGIRDGVGRAFRRCRKCGR